jgi:L-iditol 2-dehydrogenase
VVDRWTKGWGLDAYVLAVPVDDLIEEARRLLRGGGQVMLFAHTRRGGRVPVDLASICVDEKDLLGSYSADITLQREVSRLVFSRQLDVRPLVTHRLPLEATLQAVRMAANPQPETLKVMVGGVNGVG